MAGALSGTVVGKLAKDPERKANGKAVGFSIPVSKGKDKPTTWVRVTAWGKTADFVEQYLKKGSLVAASGEIELREFESKGQKGSSLEMNANSVQSFQTGEPQSGGQFGSRPAPADDIDPF
jgi:single-strand DNA-binding protein